MQPPCCIPVISIHALLAESDHTFVRPPSNSCDFYPRSPCGERLRHARNALLYGPISIHALLAESDATAHTHRPRQGNYFYPRSPCGERLKLSVRELEAAKFLSTLSLRRATRTTSRITKQHFNFYPRSPCGERQKPLKLAQTSLMISIHALLAESDHIRQTKI